MAFSSDLGPRFTLDRAKFAELIVYVADRQKDDECFGDTMLNKILFFSDFLAFRQNGKPITGAAYQKLDFGPAPRALLPVRDDLVADGSVTHVPHDNMRRATTVAARKPDLSRFTPEELAVVDEVISFCRGRTAADLSDFSHEWSAGWNLVDTKEVIPYVTALINTDGPSQAARMGVAEAIGRRRVA